MFVERHEFALVATGSDVAQMKTTLPVSARILSVHYIATTGTTGFATTAVPTVKTERSKQTVWTETLSAAETNVHRAPRLNTHSSAGAANSTSGLFDVTHFNAANEHITVSATACGDGKVGTLIVMTG